jgi:tRNA(Arg) A34 adenosine deaminase TadA
VTGSPASDRVSDDFESLRRARLFAESALDEVEGCSVEEYFLILLLRAVAAAQRGDYGIAAALVIPAGARHTVSIGASTIRSSADPTGHAEIGAIRAVTGRAGFQFAEAGHVYEPFESPLATASSGAERFERDASFNADHPVLLTTLEPCPMCTVAILNAGISEVLIASPDELGGALAPSRLERLSPIWRDLAAAHGLTVRFLAESPISSSESDLRAQLVHWLEAVFSCSRPAADAWIAAGGVLGHCAARV